MSSGEWTASSTRGTIGLSGGIAGQRGHSVTCLPSSRADRRRAAPAGAGLVEGEEARSRGAAGRREHLLERPGVLVLEAGWSCTFGLLVPAPELDEGRAGRCRGAPDRRARRAQGGVRGGVVPDLLQTAGADGHLIGGQLGLARHLRAGGALRPVLRSAMKGRPCIRLEPVHDAGDPDGPAPGQVWR